MKKLVTFVFLIGVCISISLAQQRPRSLWFERVVTYERSRQMYVALNNNLWVMYDLPTGFLYKAWNGGTNGGVLEEARNNYWFGGRDHFPHHFATQGANYFHVDVGEYFSSYTKPADIDEYYTKWPAQPRNFKGWTVERNGLTVESNVRFRGYVINESQITFNLGLILSDGTEISITEYPEYSSASNKVNLVRNFEITNIPANHTVMLSLPGGNGIWNISGSGTIQGNIFSQNSNGNSSLTGTLN